MKKRKDFASFSDSNKKKHKSTSDDEGTWKVSGDETPPDDDDEEPSSPIPHLKKKPEPPKKKSPSLSSLPKKEEKKKEVEVEEGVEDDDDGGGGNVYDDEDGDGVDDDDDDEKAPDLSIPATAPTRPKTSSSGAIPAGGLKPCMYGAKCYRKNPDHFKEFSHPGSVVPPSPPPSSPSSSLVVPKPVPKKDGIRHCRRKECGKPCGLHVQTLAKTSKEYIEIEQMLHSTNVHGYKYPNLQRIKKVTHDALDARLRASPGASKTTLMWHGTKYGFATAILHTGFQLPKNPGMFGKGLYFATDSSKSWQYSLKHFANVVLLCDVAVGNSMVVNDADYNLTFDSISKSGYQSTWAKAGTCVLYNEYIVYTLEQAVVRYIVEFERSEDDKKGTRKALPPCPFPGCYDVSPLHTSTYSH